MEDKDKVDGKAKLFAIVSDMFGMEMALDAVFSRPK